MFISLINVDTFYIHQKISNFYIIDNVMLTLLSQKLFLLDWVIFSVTWSSRLSSFKPLL